MAWLQLRAATGFETEEESRVMDRVKTLLVLAGMDTLVEEVVTTGEFEYRVKIRAFKFTTDQGIKDCVLSHCTVLVKLICRAAGEALMMEYDVDTMAKMGGRGNKKYVKRARSKRSRPREVRMIRHVCLRPFSRRWKVCSEAWVLAEFRDPIGEGGRGITSRGSEKVWLLSSQLLSRGLSLLIIIWGVEVLGSPNPRRP